MPASRHSLANIFYNYCYVIRNPDEVFGKKKETDKAAYQHAQILKERNEDNVLLRTILYLIRANNIDILAINQCTAVDLPVGVKYM